VARGQERPRHSVELNGAWVGFADDGIVGEGLVGGAFRWYPTPRLSIGPELAYIEGENHSHAVVTGNVIWDLRADARRPRGVTPFLVVGGGMFSTREHFFGSTFTSREGAFTAGGGLRAHATDRIRVGVDARVGWELHLRVGAFVGIGLGR
jgi:hypothetical protein